MRPSFVRCVVRLVFCGSLLAFARPASAEEPDMRNIQPFVMLVADTSGSMEWIPGCTCTTTGCTECLPDCSLLDNSTGKKKNRWSVLLEALTGQFTNFACKTLDRNDATQFTYDFGYSKPFNRPWVCPGGQTYCAYPGTETAPIQVQNGLLDNYSGRLQFGLATFDGMRTYTGAGDIVDALAFNTTLSEGAEGSWSYGGPKIVHYPTCGTDHMIDSGIRSPKAPEGGLITLDSPLCAQPPCDPSIVNAAIQNTLLSTRTYGGTPTAGALDDLYYHFKNDFHDKFYKCRPRYAVLISDGYPDDDFRDFPVPGCDCPARGNCGTMEDPKVMHCPYPTAVQVAYDLKHGRSSETSTDDPMIQQLFVVGMSINDTAAKTSLNAIASAGGSVDDDKDGNEAYFASDPTTLTATLDTLLGNVAKPISRSIPAFATGAPPNNIQYQVSAGFGISTVTTPPGLIPPWKGILERRRFLCDSKAQVSSPTLEDQDRFEVLLNKQTVRSLWTALPATPDHTKVEGVLDSIDSGTACGTSGCTRTELTSVPIGLLGSIDTTRQSLLMGWMYGLSGSVRANFKLGDIYHSSPAIVGPPVEDPGDQSYQRFTDWTLIQNRPTMVYVNTNDGILHAFVLEDQDAKAGTHKGGEELWGFVPPILLDDLDPQLSAHRLNLDGTPVVKDVYFSKGSVPLATDYHTVLVSGMRSGGNAYFALDVTDPDHPKFMWQFTDPDMGQTYGLPEIVQARYSWPPGQPATLRAMAILSGGKGDKITTGPGCDTSKNTALAMRVPGGGNAVFTTRSDADVNATLIKHRADIQCWGQKGRALYFVDVETGKLIKKIFDTDSDLTNGVVFPSPLIGTPTAYQDTVGTVATEGFVVDADGVLWRIDLTATDPRPTDALNGWTVRPFHDLFWDMLPDQGETTYERPILSLDPKHQLVVIVGTGDTDNFEKTEVLNRVVSLTELTTTTTPKVPSDYVAGLNWELRPQNSDTGPGFVKSELVTGSMALFDEQLYIASFIPLSLANDACAEGLGRLWAVNYRSRDTKLQNTDYGNNNSGTVITFGPQRLTLTSDDTTGANSDIGLFNLPKSTAEPNLLVTGLGTTQRISCDTTSMPLSNYFSGTATLPIKQQTQPSIWIVAQASSDNASRNRAGSKLGSVEVKMNRPLEFSQVSSWTGSIE